MKRTLTQIVLSATAVVLLASATPLQAQDVTRGTVPMNFHIGSTLFSAGSYDFSVPPGSNTFTVVDRETSKTKFAMATASIQGNDKTQQRGPVLILKCAQGACFVTEIWTGSSGYEIRHPGVLDEVAASSTHVVALARVARR